MRVALGHVQLKYETCRGGEYAAALKQIGHYAVWAEAVADRLAKPRERGYLNAAGLQAPRRLVEELLGRFGGGTAQADFAHPRRIRQGSWRVSRGTGSGEHLQVEPATKLGERKASRSSGSSQRCGT